MSQDPEARYTRAEQSRAERALPSSRARARRWTRTRCNPPLPCAPGAHLLPRTHARSLPPSLAGVHCTLPRTRPPAPLTAWGARPGTLRLRGRRRRRPLRPRGAHAWGREARSRPRHVRGSSAAPVREGRRGRGRRSPPGGQPGLDGWVSPTRPPRLWSQPEGPGGAGTRATLRPFVPAAAPWCCWSPDGRCRQRARAARVSTRLQPERGWSLSG